MGHGQDDCFSGPSLNWREDVNGRMMSAARFFSMVLPCSWHAALRGGNGCRVEHLPRFEIYCPTTPDDKRPLWWSQTNTCPLQPHRHTWWGEKRSWQMFYRRRWRLVKAEQYHNFLTLSIIWKSFQRFWENTKSTTPLYKTIDGFCRKAV